MSTIYQSVSALKCQSKVFEPYLSWKVSQSNVLTSGGGCDNCDENWLSCFSTISTLFLFFSGFWNLKVYKILCKISLRKSNTQVVFAPLETYILPIVYEWLQGKSLSWHTIECTTEVPGSDFLRFVDASRSFWTHVLKISYDSSMMLGNFQT